MDLQKISQQLKIHIERLSVVSIHHNEEVNLKPNEFIIDLTKTTYEKILQPDKIYEHCAIIQDNIHDSIIYHEGTLKTNSSTSKTDNIFIFEDIITIEQCNHIIEIMETYFKKKEYKIGKWEKEKNTNCIFIRTINELENMVYDIINKIIIKLYKDYRIICRGDSGYCYRKIFGPTRLHTDGLYVEKDKEYIPMNQIRNMSVIICLNDDYEGGEFYFPKQDRTIKLKKGNIIVFPPYWTHPHMTYPLLNNTYRYTINTWLYE